MLKAEESFEVFLIKVLTDFVAGFDSKDDAIDALESNEGVSQLAEMFIDKIEESLGPIENYIEEFVE